MAIEMMIKALINGLGLNPDDLIRRANELQAGLSEFVRQQQMIMAKQEEVLARMMALEDGLLELQTRLPDSGSRERQASLLQLGVAPDLAQTAKEWGERAESDRASDEYRKAAASNDFASKLETSEPSE